MPVPAARISEAHGGPLSSVRDRIVLVLLLLLVLFLFPAWCERVLQNSE
jgi:hypothetical protein